MDLDLAAVRMLVVGGGPVATRKVRGLIEFGGNPKVIAPETTEALDEMEEAGQIVVERRGYREGDESGCALVFAATDDPDLNARIAELTHRRGGLANVVNVPGSSSFRVPAVLRRGPVTIACSTGGGSPLLARRLRDRVAGLVGPEVGRGAERLARLREEIRRRLPEEERRREFWFNLMSDVFVDSLIEGESEEVESMIQRCLSRS